MPTPPYILELRRSHGHGLLLLPGVCGVVVRDDLEPGRRHVLLVCRSDTGAWELPAGIVEPGEQPATTIERELLEETCVVAVAERLVWLSADPEVVVYPNGDRCQYLTTVFRCRYVCGEARVGDEESTEVVWADLAALPPLTPDQHRRIRYALEDTERTRFER
jgi:8-oxo-dGTP pyrophosphatase MutT (NUDIX family)